MEEQSNSTAISPIIVSEEEIADDSVSKGITIAEDEENLMTEMVIEGQKVIIQYYRTFMARLIQGSEINKQYYSALKNTFKSYGIVSAISVNSNNFSYKRKPLGRIVVNGDELRIYLALNPMEIEAKYNVHDVSHLPKYQKTPCLLIINNEMSLKKALVLIKRVMKAANIEANPDYVWTDIASMYPNESLQSLIAKDYVKIIQKTNIDN